MNISKPTPPKQFQVHVVRLCKVHLREAEAGNFEEARTLAGKASNLTLVFRDSADEDFNFWLPVESPLQ